MIERICNVCGRDCTDKALFDLDGADYCSQACYDSAQSDPLDEREGHDDRV